GRKSPCFKNNWVISQILAGLFPTKDCEAFTSDANPFLRYNALVATEKPRTWENQGGPKLKDKLLFQDFRFSFKGTDKNVVTVNAGATNWDFQNRIIGLGKWDCNELAVPVEKVSRRHCVIINFSDDVWIYDLNSTNGTCVDNKKVKRKQFIVGVHKVKVADWECEISSSADLLL